MELSALVNLYSDSQYQGRSQAGQYYNSSTGLREASVLVELGLEQVLLNQAWLETPSQKYDGQWQRKRPMPASCLHIHILTPTFAHSYTCIFIYKDMCIFL